MLLRSAVFAGAFTAVLVCGVVSYTGAQCLWGNCYDGYGIVRDTVARFNYVGQFVAGLPAGKGAMRWDDGEVYAGDWIGGKRDGRGIHLYTDGTAYRGDWRENFRTGTGTMFWTDGSRYIGQWQNDAKNGAGEQTWADGERFVGTWQANYANGKGTYYFANNRSLEGVWVRGECPKNNPESPVFLNGVERSAPVAGEIVAQKANGGLQYNGEARKGIPYGKGIAKYPNGTIYDGNWQYGAPNGYGELDAFNDHYKGYFVNGKPEGWCYAQFASGAWYIGEMRERMPEGYGFYYTRSDTTLLIGNWRNQHLEGNGIALTPDGVYEGTFANGEYNGEGFFKHRKGYTFKGNFKNNILEGEGETTSPKGFRNVGTFHGGRFVKGTKYYSDGTKEDITED